MKIFVNLLFFVVLFFTARASQSAGPLYRQKDPFLQQEFDNVYQDLRSLNNFKSGTTTNDNACTGCVGEYVESNITTSANSAANNVFGNVTSISLTAGDWDVSGTVSQTINGATITGTMYGAISTFSGNTITDFSEPVNYVQGPAPTSIQDSAVTIANYRLSLASTTTVYLKQRAGYTGGPPKYVGSIRARRRR